MSIGELDYTEDFDYHIVEESGGRNFSAQIDLSGKISWRLNRSGGAGGPWSVSSSWTITDYDTRYIRRK